MKMKRLISRLIEWLKAHGMSAADIYSSVSNT